MSFSVDHQKQSMEIEHFKRPFKNNEVHSSILELHIF